MKQIVQIVLGNAYECCIFFMSLNVCVSVFVYVCGRKTTKIVNKSDIKTKQKKSRPKKHCQFLTAKKKRKLPKMCCQIENSFIRRQK